MVTGIVNITPDSFFNGGFYCNEADLLRHCETMFAEGADMIDVGAVSTRPYAQKVDTAEEMRRLNSALAVIRKHFPDVIISVDTFRADVAKTVVENYAVDIINDISAGSFDDRMMETVASLNVPYVVTHMQGTPQTMQEKPAYENLLKEIIDFFSGRIHRLRTLGIKDIILDPGFGFGKTIVHNYEILRRLKDLEIFEMPIMAGLSRKSMIYGLLETDAAHTLNGTTITNTIALMNGANILRVHDVKEAVECVQIVQQTRCQQTDEYVVNFDVKKKCSQ